jgi:hypothetical protein
MRVLSSLSSGAVRLLVSLLAYTFCLGSFGVGLVATAQAQTVPKSLEEGGERTGRSATRTHCFFGQPNHSRAGAANAHPPHRLRKSR